MQNYRKIYNQHANTTNRIVCVLHACMTQVTVQTAALHIVVPSVLPSVPCPCSSLPAPLFPRCEVSHQFCCHSPAIFQLAATYALLHWNYQRQCYLRCQSLCVDVFQTASIGHPRLDLGLQSHLQDNILAQLN